MPLFWIVTLPITYYLSISSYADIFLETDVKLRNMQNQVKKYEKYIKKVPKEILDEIEAKEREREHNKEKEMEL